MAFVSDAGTPAVSDPGALLVAAVRAAGLRVIPVPGASALTAALSAAGIEADGVVFAGFLPAKGAERRERLAHLRRRPLGDRALRGAAPRLANARPTCTRRWASATS